MIDQIETLLELVGVPALTPKAMNAIMLVVGECVLEGGAEMHDVRTRIRRSQAFHAIWDAHSYPGMATHALDALSAVIAYLVKEYLMRARKGATLDLRMEEEGLYVKDAFQEGHFKNGGDKLVQVSITHKDDHEDELPMLVLLYRCGCEVFLQGERYLREPCGKPNGQERS